MKSTWPQSDRKKYDTKSLNEQVSLLRSFSGLRRFFSSSKQSLKNQSSIKCIAQKDAIGEAANVHRCSLDARHYHLMIHGEALARRHMAKKRFYVCRHREKEIAMIQLKRLEWLQVCLKKRRIFQVCLDEKSGSYDLMHPDIVVEKNCSLTHIAHLGRR